jgi:hypothetical protein
MRHRMSRSGAVIRWSFHTRLPGESAGGVSPPAALRTGRDSLPSSGPHSPALGERDELPVGEQARLVLVDLLQPGHRFGVLAAESLELVHGPPGEVLVDAPCQEALAVSAARGPPSRSQQGTLAPLTWPPLSGRQVLLFRASARDELTPPLHRAPPGQHAGRPLAEGTHRRAFVPGTMRLPVLMPSFRLSMRRQWFTHVRLLVAHLTR